jgi:hypothetical protein
MVHSGFIGKVRTANLWVGPGVIEYGDELYLYLIRKSRVL